MRFRVLGPVAAETEGGPVPLGPARQRAVLAVLLLEPGISIPLDELTVRVWGRDAPDRARQTLYSYLSRLRGVLGEGGGPALTRASGGYILQVAPSAVDLHRFRALVADARRAADPDRAAALWHEALALWQGPPLADVHSDWLRQVAAGVEGERSAAVRDRADTLLRRGEHAGLVPELTAEAEAYPLDERVAGQLMLALYRAGRPSDALAHYRVIRDRLVDELGSDPGPELRELQQRILRQDPELDEATGPDRRPATAVAPTAVAPAAVPAASVPAQLPADVSGFTGRAAALRRLTELLRDGGGQAVLITAIGGTAGVGKTALATHWAHRVADRFPDGQLYVNLRGYDPDQPVEPADALARFLTALGVTGQGIPLELDERAARFRSELAGRRMLIVLDNAGSVAQVRPLLPGSGSCVVVTSRDSLAGLVAVDGAHRVDLDVLSTEESVDLLRRLVGDRVADEPEAAAALAEQCARLPLALRVAAELAVSRPDSGLGDLVAELADRQARLELLDAGDDPRAAVREVLSWSIQQLPDETARMFRLLGLHPGPDFDAYAAAALAGTGVDRARRILEELARAHLVNRSGGLVRGRSDRRGRSLERAGEVGGAGLGRTGRYGMHDLLRAYATHLADAEETQQQAAEDRLFDYYLATAAAAMDTLHPAEAHWRPAVPVAPTEQPDLTGSQAAGSWLDTELAGLVAAGAHTATSGRPGYPVDLARVLYRHLSSHLTAQLAINTHALRAAERAGDVVGQAHALRHLAGAYLLSGRYEEALDHGHRALTRFRCAGDQAGMGLALATLGVANSRAGRYKQAIDEHHQAIATFREAGDRLGEAIGFGNLAVVEEQLGRLSEAAADNQQALAIYRELGSDYHEAFTLSNLADVEVRQGEYAAASEHLRRALDIVAQLHIPVTEASILESLGKLHLRRGEPEAATEYFERALTICRTTGERYGQAWTLNSLGEAAQLAGRPDDALAHHTEALSISVETGTRHQQARANAGIGEAHGALGDLNRARTSYEEAHAIYAELDLSEAGEMRERLDGLTPVRTPVASPVETPGEPGQAR